MEKELNLVTFLNPFTTEKTELPIAIFGNLVDTLDHSGLAFAPGVNCVILLNGEIVPREEWEFTFPKIGDNITLNVIPQGGGGGKTVLRIVMTAALIAGTWGFGTAGAAGYWAGMGVELGFAGWTAVGINTALTYAGMLLIDKIAALPTTATSRAQEDAPKSFGIESTSNQLNPWGAVPVLLGKHRFHPPYAAQPYSEIVGDEQYINMLFCVGYYPMYIEDMKLGSTDLDDFPEADITGSGYLADETNRNIEMWMHENYQGNSATLKYFKNDIHEESFSSDLTYNNSVTRTTAANTNEIIVDVTAPNGVYGLSNSGTKTEKTVEFEIQYSLAGANNWSANSTGKVISSNVFPIPVPPTCQHTLQSKENGTTFYQGVGYGCTRIGIDKSNGGWWTANSGDNSSFDTPHLAQKRCPNFPGFVAPIATITRSSANNSLVAGNLVDKRTSELNRANSTDFLPHITGGNNITVDGGTLTLKLAITSSSSSTIRRGFRYVLPSSNTWDVKLRRITADHDPITDKIYDAIAWTALRSINSARESVIMKDITLIEIRVKASEQFNGTLDDFTVLATTICPDWVAGSSAWISRPTNNPASLFRYLLQGPFNKRPQADAKINLVALAAWHEYCLGQGFAFNLYCDYQGSIYDMLVNLAASGRSSPTYRDGKYTVITDAEQTTICQHFTPRTSWGFSSTKAFYTPPHAFRVTMADEAQDYNTEEVFVYDDGYSLSGGNNTTVATLFEEMKLIGCTSHHDSWKQGRFHLAQLRLRPETFKINVDIENIVSSRGDLVRVTHDVPLWGVASGRIKSLPQDLIVNGSFENWEGDFGTHIPDMWYHRSGGNFTANKETVNKVEGQSALRLSFNGFYPEMRQPIGYNNSAVTLADYRANNYTGLIFANNATYNQQIVSNGGPLGNPCYKFTEVNGAWYNGTERFPININTESLMVEITLRNLDVGNGITYLGVTCWDSNGIEITGQRCFRYPNPTTLYANYVAGQNYCDIVPAGTSWLNSTSSFLQMNINSNNNNDLPFPVARLMRLNSVDMSNNTYWRCYFYAGYSLANNYANGTYVGQSYGGGVAYCTLQASTIGNNWSTVRGFISSVGYNNSPSSVDEWKIGTTTFALTGGLHYTNNGAMLVDSIVVKKFNDILPSLNGQTINLGGWVRSTGNNMARIGFCNRTGTYQWSNNVVGNNTWQYLTVSHNVTAADKQLYAVCYLYDSSGTYNAWFDGLSAFTSNNITQLQLDETVQMAANNNYAVRIRTSSGNSILSNVTTVAGNNTIINLSPGIAPNIGIYPGDLFMFGKNGTESVECLVKAIKPTEDLCAEIELMDYSPAVYTADTGTIPAYDTHITAKLSDVAPLISSVRSDEKVMLKAGNIWTPRILVNFAPRGSEKLKSIAYMEGQFKVAYSTLNWIGLSNISKDAASVYIVNVEQGVTYWLRFRYIYRDGHAGPWCSSYSHLVVGKSGYPNDAAFDDANCTFSATRIQFAMVLALDFDFDFFEIRTDNNWGTAAGLIVQTRSLRYIYTGLIEINDTYYLKARDTSGHYSVTADTLTAGVDYTSDVLSITGAYSEFTTNDCFIYWDAVNPQKLLNYQVRIYSTFARTTLIYSSNYFTNPRFMIDYATNCNLSGGPRRTLYCTIVINDIYGRSFTYDISPDNPVPATITDLVVQVGLEMLVLVCGPLLGDIIGYEFGCDTDNPPSDSVEVGTNFASFAGLVAGTTYRCRVRAKDAFGYGSWSTVATGVPETLTVDETVMDLPMYQNAGWNNNGASQITWANHTLLWKGNSYNIAGGNAGTSIFVYWNSSAPTTYTSGNTMPLDSNTWMLCYRSNNLVFPAVQSPIINGGLIHANTMHADRILAGTLYVSNIVGSSGSLNFTSSGSINFASPTGNFAISAGNVIISANATFTVTATAGMNFNTANGIIVQAGSGISLAGNASTPGIIKLYKSGLAGNWVTMGGFATYFAIYPSSNGTEDMYLGSNTSHWNTINIRASNSAYLVGNTYVVMSCPGAYVSCTGTNAKVGATTLEIDANKSINSSTDYAGFIIGSYTGNGSNNRTMNTSSRVAAAIWINEVSADGAHAYAHYTFKGSANVSSAHAGTTLHGNSTTITGVNSTGFQVNIGASGWGPNVNAQVYEYLYLF